MTRPLGLPLAWLAVFFRAVAIVALYSFNVYSLFPGEQGFTFKAWHDFFHSSLYLSLFWKSVQMSLIVSVITVALAYPLAYFLALAGTKRKYVLLLLLIAPFLTSYLLRVLAWKVILGDHGVINSAPVVGGQIRDPGPPSSLSFCTAGSRSSSCSSTSGCRSSHCRSSSPSRTSTGGCSRRRPTSARAVQRAFLRVTLPLSLPGVVAAFLFVFIPTLGEFVTPSLVGGVTGYMYGNQIVDLFGAGFPDWETGSVLASS